MNETIQNPILPGFHPDPSIVRIGSDFYLATSTFEWFPGVALFHSRDLKHWRPIGHVLTRTTQLPLMGVEDSCGTWAPSLSYDGRLFHLVVCHVRNRQPPVKDMRVMLYTAEQITGPWSDPIEIGRSGFDPSIFHDDDGRKWLVNLQWDFRKTGYGRFGGIVIQEYDPKLKKCVGKLTTILQKPSLLEGPNLYKRNGWYYLMVAEGGTGWNHSISLARSKNITGPYEVDPETFLTTRDDPGNRLQRAGHGELVELADGEAYVVHLASRPLYPQRLSLLGRETNIQKVIWGLNGWLRLAHGGIHPCVEVQAPTSLEPNPWPAEPSRDEFDGETLSPHWQALRVPIEPSWASLTARRGHLRLRGRESISSLFEQSLVARRIESFQCRAETKIDFQPIHFTQAAGLICYYDIAGNFYLRVSYDEHHGRVLDLVQTDNGAYSEHSAARVIINDSAPIHLRAEVDFHKLQFSMSRDGETWQNVGEALPSWKLADEYGKGGRFTGPMVGICCQDLNYAQAVADFDYFELIDLSELTRKS